MSAKEFLVHIERVSDAKHQSGSHRPGEIPSHESEDDYCENIICSSLEEARVIASREASDQATAQSSDGGVWRDLIDDGEEDAHEIMAEDLADYTRGIDILLTQAPPVRYTFNGGHFIEITPV